MQQSVMYCGTVLPATRQMLATSNVRGVDAAVRHVLFISQRKKADGFSNSCVCSSCLASGRAGGVQKMQQNLSPKPSNYFNCSNIKTKKKQLGFKYFVASLRGGLGLCC